MIGIIELKATVTRCTQNVKFAWQNFGIRWSVRFILLDKFILRLMWFRVVIPLNRYYTLKIERVIGQGYAHDHEFYPDIDTPDRDEDFYHTER